ncbi:YeeE/YedE family protein [Citrobacter sp. BDA59-3]|uniref:YeeE/YedE family protein n=1 Tax=Citrobacter sp. BDA59-3 TaxID=2781952 RepID=UPI0018804A61|nr:YeeE/YedE family protein [Citrobacter sp. BDA59-3]QOV66599.1 YeeE/YedE family protein [Citrobacter sp. BDA59-3]
MMIDWTHFTPLECAIGGAVIGAAASMLILFCGRVAGISGILGGVLSRANNDKGWRIAFLLGMVLSPVLWRLAAPLPAVSITASWPMLVVAGLLVGVGTRYGSGCTSGHGVCGLSRLSVRSLIATLIFMAAAFITVWLVGFWRG